MTGPAHERVRSHRLGPWRVDVTVRAGVAVPVPVVRLARAVAAALDAAGAPGPASIGLILADDGELATLNEAQLGSSGPTDVLSFPLLAPAAFPSDLGASATERGGSAGRARSAGPPAADVPAFVLPPGRRVHLGDIVVSVERAIEQAGTGRGGQTGDVRWSAGDELALLVVHGTLHICGRDHVLPAEEAAMRELERTILAGV